MSKPVMRFVQMSTEISVPRPSSTVVLVRRSAAAPEVLMVKRDPRSSFGDAYAFPGGVLEDADHRIHDQCAGVTSSDADRLLEVDTGGLDYFSAAVRELFEEAGVLLGETRCSRDELAQSRDALNEGSLRWDRFVEESGLVLRCDRLHYFSFWITPTGLPKRYSTRFFLAKLPEGQSAIHCGGELTNSCWMPALGVLQAAREGRMRVHLPTRKTLERIARFDSLDALLAWATSCAEAGVACPQPASVPASD